MKTKLIMMACFGLAACVEPQLPGYDIRETSQSVQDTLPGGVSFDRSIPFFSVSRTGEAPFGPGDVDQALAVLGQYCAAKEAQFVGSGRNITLGLPSFRDGAWLIGGSCTTGQIAGGPPVVVAPPAPAVAPVEAPTES